MRNEVSLLFIIDAYKIGVAWIIKSDRFIRGGFWYFILKRIILNGNDPKVLLKQRKVE